MDITAVSELVKRVSYPLTMEGYQSRPPMYPRIGRVIPTDGSRYGEKGGVITRAERPVIVKDGEEVPDAQFAEGPTWRIAIPAIARRIDIPERMLLASDANARITGLLTEHSRGMGELFIDYKEDFVAGMLQKGTLTAGSLAYFNNSFPGGDPDTDATGGFIYDGLPFFDTAHTITGPGLSGTTFSNHDVSAPLTSANLELAITRMRTTNARDERNVPVTVNPRALIVGAALGFGAQRLINSTLLPGSAQNDVNVLNGALEVIVWDRLTDDATAWWLAEPGMGLNIYDSGSPTIKVEWNGIKRVHQVVWSGYFGAGVTNWRYWYNADKAAS